MSEVDDCKPHLRRLFDGKMYELSGEMIVGRLAECNIVLDQESGASRKHARFAVVEQDVFITDLGSLNGTLVNGKAIKEKAQLATGDILIFDEIEYEMLIPGQSSEPQIDPNMTVLINRDEIGNRQLIEPDTGEVDDEKFESAVAVAVAAAAVEEDAEAEAEAQSFARAASEANGEADARAASEAKAEADARAASEAKAEADARAVSEARPQVEAKVETVSEAKAEHVPGSWSDPTAGSNLGNTIFVDAIDFSNAQAVQAAQVDSASLTEPTLVVKTGENAGAMLRLVGEQTEWSIGSGADRNLALTESGVSTNHAAIVREGSKWKVVDQMSFNGTSVNDVPVNIRFINDGDKLHFGPVECLFVVPAGFVGATNSGETSGNASLLWKVAATIVILLVLGGGYYAYSAGMLSSVGTPAATNTQ